MSVEAVKATYKQKVANLGQQTISTLFPNDFEAYLMALELTDSQDNTIDYLAFPVMPDSIQKNDPKYSTLKKSGNGITVLTSPSFVPQSISIKGDFGRSFKILLGPGVSTQGAAFSTTNGKYDLWSLGSNHLPSLGKSSFNAGIKTGYGATKILKAIISKSNGLDKLGKPFRLYFYNMALGESFLVIVPPSGLTLSQNLSKNMIWEYQLTLTAIAPMEAAINKKNKSSNIKMMSSMSIQQAVNSLASSLVTDLG